MLVYVEMCTVDGEVCIHIFDCLRAVVIDFVCLQSFVHVRAVISVVCRNFLMCMWEMCV